MEKLKRQTLLIVEDEPLNIEIYKEILEKEYDLVIAETGSQALEAMAHALPDLVLLDMLLPDTKGTELCRQFKSDERSRHIPVIIVTTLKNKADKIEGLKAGANDYLFKPIDRDELQLKLKNHMLTKTLRDQLNDSFENIVNLNDITASMMKNFDPNFFKFNRNILKLLKDYAQNTKELDQLPAYVMIAVKNDDNKLDAMLYRREDRGFILLKSGIIIEEMNKYAITNSDAIGDVSYENRTKSAPDLDTFQTQFHPEVRNTVGKIFNYINYTGGEVYTIGFNYSSEVNPSMAQIFKSFTINGNFFKVIQDQIGEIKGAYSYALNSLARAAEASDELTGEHIQRVNQYSGFIAEKLGLSSRLIQEIFASAQMHDIGKVHIHPDIIQKPGKLTDEEWRLMRMHPAYGAKILGKSEFMRVARNICLYHHENSDGSGYPQGLTNKEIPIEARVVHLADVYDSLRSPRSYKPAFDHQKTVSIILDGDGRTSPAHFDPDIIEIFKTHHRRFDEIYKSLTEVESE